MFKKATKAKAKLRLALQGPAGSGKTWTALTIAGALGQRVAVIDTEHGSASKYGDAFDFDVCELDEHHHSPEDYAKALTAAQEAGYDVVIADSITHEWDWCLREVDRVAAAKYRGNSYAAWGDVTPRHNLLRDAILGARCHVIATMRSKTEYVLTENTRGKQEPTKVGMKAVQRDGLDYEFDVVCELTVEHVMAVTKSRCTAVADYTETKPGARFAGILKAWLEDGVEVPTFPAVCRAYELVSSADELTAARALASAIKHTLPEAQLRQLVAADHIAVTRTSEAPAEREREPGEDDEPDEMDPEPPADWPGREEAANA